MLDFVDWATARDADCYEDILERLRVMAYLEYNRD
jgi:hypothetical protein